MITTRPSVFAKGSAATNWSSHTSLFLKKDGGAREWTYVLDRADVRQQGAKMLDEGVPTVILLREVFVYNLGMTSAGIAGL